MYSVPNYVEVSENKSIVKVFTVVGSQIMLISSLAFSGGGSTPYNLLENNMPHIYEMPVNENNCVHVSFGNNERIIFEIIIYHFSNQSKILS